MARVTVEDCIEVINNRFKLVLMSSQRARDIGAGQTPMVERDNDKNTVIALREIADQLVDMDELEKHIARGVNRRTEATDEDNILSTIQSEGWLSQQQMDELSEAAPIEEISFEATDSQPTEEIDMEEEALEAAANTEEQLPSDEDLSEAISQ